MTEKDLSRGALQRSYDKQLKDVLKPAAERFEEGDYPYTDETVETSDETEDEFHWVEG